MMLLGGIAGRKGWGIQRSTGFVNNQYVAAEFLGRGN